MLPTSDFLHACVHAQVIELDGSHSFESVALDVTRDVMLLLYSQVLSAVACACSCPRPRTSQCMHMYMYIRPLYMHYAGGLRAVCDSRAVFRQSRRPRRSARASTATILGENGRQASHAYARRAARTQPSLAADGANPTSPTLQLK